MRVYLTIILWIIFVFIRAYTRGVYIEGVRCVVLSEAIVFKTQPEKKIGGDKALHRTITPPTSSFKFFS